jgi:hypothetical protein
MKALKIDQLKAIIRDLDEGYDATSSTPGFNPFENLKAPRFRNYYHQLPLERGRYSRLHRYKPYKRRKNPCFIQRVYYYQVFDLFLEEPF